MAKKKSFINRKRPAVKGLVEDFLEETGQLDETVMGKIPPKKIKTGKASGRKKLKPHR